ncbi:hypothetical protein F4780DRAFT_780841 [Xylariomycetidae sp. FL0641]|nr:hypothetical protein F4780DRAFT_780841 [Xylariomycetidae sp. FL0641]
MDPDPPPCHPSPAGPVPLTASRASPADLPAIAALQYACFPPAIRALFMGCASEADLPGLAARYRETLATNPHDLWLKVTLPSSSSYSRGDDDDENDGKDDENAGEHDAIIAASNWRIYATGDEAEGADEHPEPGLEGELRDNAARLWERVNAARRRHMSGGGFVHLRICFTSPAHHRRGAGAAMLRWGCAVADAAHLPMWIEASAEGCALYRRFGFCVVGEAGDGGVYMRRDGREGCAGEVVV